MANRVLILLGTKKGAFILSSDAERRHWQQSGPFCETWPLNHVIADPATGTIYAGGGNEWFGPAVWKSTDLGASWTHSSEGLAYPEGEEPIKSVWSVAPAKDGLYAGVEPAGLFRSDDDGQSWRHVGGLRDHPSRPHWNPGGAGLILHSLVPHPADPRQIWVGISSAGVFHTADGGDQLGAAQPRHQGRLSARGAAIPGVRPVRALPGDGAGPARSPLPAEPLRHVPQRGRRPAVAEHRGGPAVVVRLSGGGPSARPGNPLPRAAQRRQRGPLRP